MSLSALRTSGAARVLLAGALLLLGAFGCDTGAPRAGEPTAPAGDATPAATVDGRTITIAEVDQRIKEDLFEQATEGGDPAKLYDLRGDTVEEMVDQELVEAEAARRGMGKDELLQAEAEKVQPVTDGEVQAFYDGIKDRLGDTKLEAVAPQIRQRLEGQRQAEVREAFLSGLREKAAVDVLIEPPRIEVATSGPSRGPESAPVTIVEFSDYQCPFCKRAEPTLDQLVARYPEQVRIVYRHFPLDNIHPQARPAAEAAACAQEQGKFWEYHALVFQSSPKLEKETLLELAKKAGLDSEAFRTCFEEGRYREQVSADLEAGREAGVSGTPAFFVNGIPLSGAQPLEEFVELIEKELEGGRG